MAELPSSRQLKVSLAEPKVTGSGHKIIRVTYGGVDKLDISLRRTVRVPDNGTTYELPPDYGPFPSYLVTEYKPKLPLEMSLKGGLFVPIYGKSHL
jgi:hypothetical protein